MKQRRFSYNTFQHIYQRTYGNGAIFYCLEDYLMLYSIIAVYARKYNIKMAALCFMINHIHSVVLCRSKQILSKFVQDYTSVFVKAYNRYIDREGSLFVQRFGSAPKKGEKAVRTILNYVNNNPIEKKVCIKAENYRWNFIAYSQSKNPFSKPIDKKKLSARKRNLLKYIDSLVANEQHLSYEFLSYLFKGTSTEEKEQLTDYIISAYNVVDYSVINEYYHDYQSFLTAMHSNTGNEYDIVEQWDSSSDAPYQELIALSEKMGYIGRKRQFHKLKNRQMEALILYLLRESKADYIHIAKLLHLDVKYVSHVGSYITD